MACADQVPRVALKEVNEPLFQREKAILPGKKKDMAAAADEVDMEKVRKALVVVAEELEAKTIKGSGGSKVETGKEMYKKQAKRSVKAERQQAAVEAEKQQAAVEAERKQQAAVEAERKQQAAVEAEKQQAERSVVDRILDEYQFVDLFEEGPDDEVDEEDLKKAAELHGYISGMWKEWADRAVREGIIEFADPSDPHCLVAC